MSLLVSKILQLVYLSAITRIASSESMIEKGSNCGPPTPPYGSTIIYPRSRNEHSNGTVVLFGCKPGFYLVGPSLITCIANSWTEIKFRCIGFCPVFRHIMNGEVLHVSPVIGKAAVEFRCHDKYRLIGRRRLECISGRWNGNMPFCKKLKTCGRLQPPINGNLHGRDISHGATVSFACFAGFDLFGLRSITCNNGFWSGNVPSCKAYCTRIVKPLNGWKYGTQFSHGSVVLFKCKTGYKLVGDHALQCTNGKWNSSVPICNVMLCSRPSIPSNSYIVYPATTQDHHVHGTRLFLACRSGHFLIGTPIMTCNQTGWIQTEFNCIASCPVLGSVKNGIVTHVTLKGGGEVEIKCQANYTLVGSATLVCSNGAWNDSLPNCSAPCKEPVTPLRGWKSNRDFRHGHSVNFFCYGSYDRIGASSISCNNGTWDEQVPVCKARCRNPGSPIHGRKRGEIYRHNSWVQFLCDVNYLLDGDPWIQCIDGSWSGPVAKCRVVDCGLLEKPDHGNIIEEVGTTYGKRIIFECAEKGYELVGSRERTCQSDGTWSGQPTTCERVKCGDPGVPLNGKRIVSKGFVYGGSVRFECNTNYTLMKGMPVAIYCQADKAWSGSLPRCLAPCPDPGVPYQATRNGHDFRHEHTVRFTCPTNYRLEGIDEITCSNGRWSGRAPLCKAPCEDLAKPANGWKWGGFRHGSKVIFRCYSGYQKIGTDFTTCNDGTWTNDAPACKARCIFPGNPDNGFLLRAFRNRGDIIKHGERITYGCLEGYSLIGTATQECNDGRWINGRPVCKVCRNPLGMENSLITDSRITSPDYHSSPNHARLNGKFSWCETEQTYLQIDLGKRYKLTAVATQGGQSYNGLISWVQRYRISFFAGPRTEIYYSESETPEAIEGNQDNSTIKTYVLKEPFVTKVVRIYPSFDSTPVCLRMELYGCEPKPDCIHVGSVVWGSWDRIETHYIINYYLAYITKLNATHVDFVLDYYVDKALTRSYNRTEPVLVIDKIPEMKDISVGSRVIGVHRKTHKEWYQAGTVTSMPDSRYVSVRFDRGVIRRRVPLDQLRLVRRPRFCTNGA